MAWTKVKTAIVVVVVVILTGGMTTTLVMRHRRQADFLKESWAFAGYSTPEDTAQSVFWAMREGNSSTFRAYLNGLSPEASGKMEKEIQSRGGDGFAELSAHEMGGVTRYRILKKVKLSNNRVELQFQFNGLNGPVQTLTMEKLGNEWKFADEGKN